MLKSICDELYKSFLAELRLNSSKEDIDAMQISANLMVIKKYLQVLRLTILEKGFKDEDEEINFFKYIKPRFLATKMFVVEQYNLEQSKQVGTWEKHLAFYDNELEAINRFYRQHAYVHQYYKMALTELDRSYFLRGKEAPSIFVYDVDETFLELSTWGDYMFSKFKAYEMLQEFILQQIKNGSSSSQDKQRDMYQSKTLNWTGESINLVELGYALLDSGQINNGKAGVNDIFKWFEEHFNVSIGIPARRFVEIRRRKRLSRTRFLDNLRDSVNRKIDDDDAFNPGKPKSKRN